MKTANSPLPPPAPRVLLLGASGYVGSAFRALFDAQGVAYRALSRADLDYYDRQALVDVLRRTRPALLINAAGYTGKPNVDACELHKADCLLGNAVLPAIIREACQATGVPWGHVSSGCIYSGTRAGGSGFRETDPPNFCFRSNHCSFYSGCKALGEECLQGAERCYVWRLRMPFNQLDSPRNYLSKLMRYPRLLQATNSLSQLDEAVAACWETWQRQAPFGTYNITNPGAISTSEVVELIQQVLQPAKRFEFFRDDQQFMQLAAKTPRSNCTLDTAKLQAVGIQLTPVRQAITDALHRWEPAERE